MSAANAIKTFDERIEESDHASVSAVEQLEMSRAEVAELRASLAASERRNLELTRVYAERGFQIERLDVALARATAIPAGFALVPIAITDDMVIAFCETWYIKIRCYDDPEMDDCWAALLAEAKNAT